MNEAILKRFAKLLAANRLAHAYLFVGPQGLGKSEAALTVAKLVNCERNDGTVCDACSSCRKITSGNHPDIYRLDRGEEEAIKIEPVRELLSRTAFRPFEARRKVFIIKNIEDLTTEAGNVLLKTLEEPTASNLFLLTTSVPEKVLETIKSRCHNVSVHPVARAQLANALKKDFDLDEPAAHFLAGFSEGCTGRARAFVESKLFSRKNTTIDQVVLSKNSEAFFKKVVTSKEETKEMLDVLFVFFRDILIVKSGASEDEVINRDRLTDLKLLSQKYLPGDVQNILTEIVKSSQLLSDNLNVKIALNLLKARIAV